jgi:hypothetical protein
MEITEIEAKTLEDFANELLKQCKPAITPDAIGLTVANQSYFYALCVKYGQNPFEVSVSWKNRRFEKRDES